MGDRLEKNEHEILKNSGYGEESGSELPKCFNCGYKASENGFAQALVRVYSREEEDVEIVDGKRNPSYSTRERWCCLKCLFTSVGSDAFEDGIDLLGDME